MAQISISPWHLARHHGFLIARTVRKIGIRETARRAKLHHMVVSRFCASPTATTLTNVYRIADAVGLVFVLPEKPAK